MKKKMIMNTITSLISNLVNVVYGFVLPRLILEQFGSDVNGLTQSIKQFLGVISFLDMGVGQIARSALYKPLAQKDYGALSRVMVSGGKFYRKLARALLVYVVILTLVYPALAAQQYEAAFVTSLIVSMAVGSFCQYYFGIANEQLLHADQRGYVIFSLQILTNLLNALVCILVIRMGGSIQMVKWATAMVFLLRPLVICLYVKKHYPIDKHIQYDEEPIKQKWNGIAQHVSAVVLDGTDTIVLTVLSTLSNVSVYSVYYMVIGSIQSLYQSATAGVQSAAGALWAGGNVASQKKMFSTTELVLHSVTVILFCCTGLLIVPFVRVYTEGLTDAQYIQPLFSGLLVLAYGIRCLRTPYNIWILAAGHYKQTQRCHIVAAALNLLISVFAVSRWGLVGVAIGTVVAMTYQTAWMVLYNAHHLLKWPLRSLIKRFAVDILTAGLIVLLCRRFVMQDNSYLGWFLLAVKTGCTALAVTAVTTLVFYRRLALSLLRRGA